MDFEVRTATEDASFVYLVRNDFTRTARAYRTEKEAQAEAKRLAAAFLVAGYSVECRVEVVELVGAV